MQEKNRKFSLINLFKFVLVKSLTNKIEVQHQLPKGEKFRYSYKLIKDCFVNTILLEISQEKTIYPIKISISEKFRIQEVINFNFKNGLMNNFLFRKRRLPLELEEFKICAQLK